MAKSKEKKKANPKLIQQSTLKKVQLEGNTLFKDREVLLANLELVREALQANLNQQHELEEKIKNG